MEAARAETFTRLSNAFTEVAAERFQNADSVTNLVSLFTSSVESMTIVGPALGITANTLPDTRRRDLKIDILSLNKSIQRLQLDDQNHKHYQQWLDCQGFFVKTIYEIKHGTRLIGNICTSTREERENTRERLEEYCRSMTIQPAVDHLLDGLAGQGEFEKEDILENCYRITDGNRPKIVQLAGRLLLLVFGGMFTVITYERLKRGQSGVNQLTKQYNDRLQHAKKRIAAIIEKCEENIETNMKKDLQMVVNKHTDLTNGALAKQIFQTLEKKYDWVRLYVLVFDDPWFTTYCFSGWRVSIQDYEGRCYVVFYHEYEYEFRQENKKHIAEKIVFDARTTRFNASKVHGNISNRLQNNDIDMWGLAVIAEGLNAQGYHNVTKLRIFEDGPHFTIIALLM